MKYFDTLSFASLGSGSKGNGTVVAYEDTCVLVDCGFSLKETERRLQRIELSPEQLNAIVVTHEHGDHIGGVGVLARRYGIPVYLTKGTQQSGRLGEVPQLEFVQDGQSFQLQSLRVDPVTVPHDAKEPVQYVFRNHHAALGVLTDLGCITPRVIEHYGSCDALLLESNHCEEMLARGPYPETLKQRVGSDWGHLNNQQTAFLLQQIRKQLKVLVLGHLSEQNNCPNLVRDVLGPYFHKADQVVFACQDQGTRWLEVSA